MALHDNLSRRFVIDFDHFFIEDSDTVIVTKGAGWYEGFLQACKYVCLACLVWKVVLGD